MRILTAALALTLILTALSVSAQTLYRYKDADGRVVYTDRPPLPEEKATDLTEKRAGGNYIETDKMPLSTREVMKHSPVTLYAFACGEVCENAEDLLRSRGIPYTYVDASKQAGAKKLTDLTGSSKVPVLQVGTDLLSGFNPASWNAKLTEVGFHAKDAGAHTAVKYTAGPGADNR